jgi:transcriptional regulator with XRE-family HTH domain
LGYSDSGLQTAEVPKSAFSRKYQHFRRLLTGARLRAGLTQAALAEKLGRPQSFVSKFENGERRLDVIEFLDVARALTRVLSSSSPTNGNDPASALPFSMAFL